MPISAREAAERCLSTGGVSLDKEGVSNAAACAADAYCGSYGVPPDICGPIAKYLTGELIGALEDTFSNAGGASSASWLALYYLRGLHDRLFPDAAEKWNDARAWAKGAHTFTVASSISVPWALYALLDRNGWSLQRSESTALLSPLDRWMHTQKPSFYDAAQKQFLSASARARAELAFTAAEGRAAPSLRLSGVTLTRLAPSSAKDVEAAMRASQARAHRVVVAPKDQSWGASAIRIGGAALAFGALGALLAAA